MADFRLSLTLIYVLSGKPFQIARPLVLQNKMCGFEEGWTLKKIQLNRTQNGRLSAIIYFNMHNIGKGVPDSYTIAIK